MEVDGAAAAGAASAGAKPLTPEEEALRRSTDCVYFLASPLTCKKVRRFGPFIPRAFWFLVSLVAFEAIGTSNLRATWVWPGNGAWVGFLS
jgi:hypothetical protein